MLNAQQRERIAKLFSAGLDAEDQGNRDKAKSYFEECIAVVAGTNLAADDPALPKISHSYVRLAQYLRDEGDYQSAIELATRALVGAKSKWPGLSVIGHCHRELGHFRQAESAFREALSQTNDPNKKAWFCNFLVSVISKDASRKEETLHLLQQAVELNPNYEESLHNLAVALLERGDFDAAQKHLERAIALDPNYANAYLQLGRLFMAREDLDTARGSLERAAELEPDSALAQQELGRLFLWRAHKSPNPEQLNANAQTSENYLRRSIELDPKDVWSYGYLMNLYWTWHRYRKAEEEGRVLVNLFPESSAAHWLFGDYLASTNRSRPRAEALLKRAVELNPEDPEACYAYGKALLGWGRFVEARPLLERAHQLGNESALALLNSWVSENSRSE